MKRLLSLFLAMMALVIPTVAQDSESESDNPPKPITIETDTKDNSDGSGRHRAPMHISIEAYYTPTTQTIDIYYAGETEGEVYLYLNDALIDYDSDINTSFQISAHGLYKIEIIAETWIAEGYIRL